MKVKMNKIDESKMSNNEIENDKKVRNIMRMIDKYADMYLDGMTGEKSMDMELRRLHADIRYKIEDLIEKCAPIHGNFTESTDESNQINEKIANYESHLRDAAKHIDKALNEISSLSGSSELADIRNNLGDVLALVQFTIRGIYRLYDNPEIMNGIEAHVSEGIENDVVEGIPNWAAYYIGYGEVTDDMTSEDVKMVDDYLRKLDNDGIRLIAPIEGTENEFNPHPAFGDACDTTDWSCEIDG